MDVKIAQVVQRNNEIINNICEKYRLYPKLISYKLDTELVYTFEDTVWRWIYHYIEHIPICIPHPPTLLDKFLQLVFNVEVLEDIYDGKEDYFTKVFIEQLRNEVERSKEENE